MRRDVYLENDSGGLSVIAAAAADAIIEDARGDDMRFVLAHQAMLLELSGDDSMPVRIVVDEPLTADEQDQWLAKASARLDAPDGRLLVMGGFDPDVLGWWRDEQAPDDDGRGVAVIQASPGSWRADLYAHVGSMNGRQVLDGAKLRPGAWFRKDHAGRAFPIWLAKMLNWSGEDDPGNEGIWSDVPAAVREGRLELDHSSAATVGFLLHLTPFKEGGGPLSEPGWIPLDEGARLPARFPLGLPAAVTDPDLESFLDDALAREKPTEEVPPANAVRSVIDAWRGDALAPWRDGKARAVAPTELNLLYWMSGFSSDSSPRYEIRMTNAAAWNFALSRPEVAVLAAGDGAWTLGPPPNSGGWFTWWSADRAARVLTDLPDGAAIEVAIERDAEHDADDEPSAPGVGRARYRGLVRDGRVEITDVSPAVDPALFDQALAFTRALAADGRIEVGRGTARAAFDAAVGAYVMEEDGVRWRGDVASLADPDERTQWLLAGAVFRTRFASLWPMDPVEGEGDADDA